jgi:hypothetical protein
MESQACDLIQALARACHANESLCGDMWENPKHTFNGHAETTEAGASSILSWQKLYFLEVNYPQPRFRFQPRLWDVPLEEFKWLKLGAWLNQCK